MEIDPSRLIRRLKHTRYDVGPRSRPARRRIEIENLKAVNEYVEWHVANRTDGEVTISDVLELHRLTVQGLYSCAGTLRDAFHAVTVESTTFTPAPPDEVPYLVREILRGYHRDYAAASIPEKIDAAARLFHRFNQIHPFRGGNGRTSRAILDLILRHSGHLPFGSVSFFLKRRRKTYFKALKAADNGEFAPIGLLVRESVLDALFFTIGTLLEERARLHRLSPTARLALYPHRFHRMGLPRAMAVMRAFREESQQLLAEPNHVVLIDGQPPVTTTLGLGAS